jgi:hypothetical protein
MTVALPVDPSLLLLEEMLQMMLKLLKLLKLLLLPLLLLLLLKKRLLDSIP